MGSVSRLGTRSNLKKPRQKTTTGAPRGKRIGTNHHRPEGGCCRQTTRQRGVLFQKADRGKKGGKKRGRTARPSYSELNLVLSNRQLMRREPESTTQQTTGKHSFFTSHWSAVKSSYGRKIEMRKERQGRGPSRRRLLKRRVQVARTARLSQESRYTEGVTKTKG